MPVLALITKSTNGLGTVLDQHKSPNTGLQLIFVSHSPLKTNWWVCFWQELWSRLKCNFIERKIIIWKSPMFCWLCERQGTSFPRGCHHGHMVSSLQKRDTHFVGWRKRWGDFNSRTRSWSECTPRGLKCWPLSYFESTVDPTLPRLLAGSQLFSRRFHRTLISADDSILCLHRRAFLLPLAIATEFLQNMYVL